MTRRFEPVATADIQWRDGQLYARQFSDTCFSSHNDLEESRHVFMEGNGLLTRWNSSNARKNMRFTIAEMGFGTGLNFLLAYKLWLEHAPEGGRLQFFSCEKHPLKKEDMARAVRLYPQLTQLSQQLLDQWPAMLPGWHILEFEQGRVTLILMIEDDKTALTSMLQSGTYDEARYLSVPKVDAWFLNGFAPLNNSQTCSSAVCSLIAMLSTKNSTFACVSVAESIYNGLEEVGFKVKKKPGFKIKHEILCGKLTDFSLKKTTFKPSTAWHYAYPKPKLPKKAVIIGGGLAGSFLSYFLAHRGWDITILDTNTKPGEGGSANTQAVTFPHFSAYDSPLSRFMLQSWQYAINFYASFCTQSVPHEFNGLISIDEALINDGTMLDFISDKPSLGVWMDAKKISNIAKHQINSSGIFFPKGGWIDAAALCQQLIAHPNIQWKGNQHVSELQFNNDEWYLNDERTSTVILANAHHIKHFPQTDYIAIKGIRGQMSYVEDKAHRRVAVPVCGLGHILPPRDKKIAIGATYDLVHSEPFCADKDDYRNIGALESMPLSLGKLEKAIDHWSGVRAVCSDYLPVAGPLVREQAFVTHYQRLQKNAKLSIPIGDVSYPGLYVLAGFGSRGLLSIPYCARWLSGILNNEGSIFPKDTQKALSPSRFLLKKIIRGYYG